MCDIHQWNQWNVRSTEIWSNFFLQTSSHPSKTIWIILQNKCSLLCVLVVVFW